VALALDDRDGAGAADARAEGVAAAVLVPLVVGDRDPRLVPVGVRVAGIDRDAAPVAEPVRETVAVRVLVAVADPVLEPVPVRVVVAVVESLRDPRADED
jgi:hypothetical protein